MHCVDLSRSGSPRHRRRAPPDPGDAVCPWRSRVRECQRLQERHEPAVAIRQFVDDARERVAVQGGAIRRIRADVEQDDLAWARGAEHTLHHGVDVPTPGRALPPEGVDRPAQAAVAGVVHERQRPGIAGAVGEAFGDQLGTFREASMGQAQRHVAVCPPVVLGASATRVWASSAAIRIRTYLVVQPLRQPEGLREGQRRSLGAGVGGVSWCRQGCWEAWSEAGTSISSGVSVGDAASQGKWVAPSAGCRSNSQVARSS